MHLREGVDKRAVLERVTAAADAGLGDSVACVGAPRKGGGSMAKVHIHCNEPDAFFDLLSSFSETPILRKEKVDDMYAELKGGRDARDYSNASFNIVSAFPIATDEAAGVGFCLPMCFVPDSTQEPIDVRLPTVYETNSALNAQRHADTRVRYTSSIPNPTQIKIELQAALASGRPVLMVDIPRDRNITAYGRNIRAAVDSLSPSDRARLTIVKNGWVGGIYSLICEEALTMAAEGLSIGEAAARLETIDVCAMAVKFVDSDSIDAMYKWKPSLFPEGFTVEAGKVYAVGPSTGVRRGAPLTDTEKMRLLTSNILYKSGSAEEAYTAEIDRIKRVLQPGQAIASVLIRCAGRVDYGNVFASKLRAAGVPVLGEVGVFPAGFFFLFWGSWGMVEVAYKIVDAATGACPTEI